MNKTIQRQQPRCVEGLRAYGPARGLCQGLFDFDKHVHQRPLFSFYLGELGHIDWSTLKEFLLPRVAENTNTGESNPIPWESRRTNGGEYHWARISHLILVDGTAGVALGGATERAATAKPRAHGELCGE